MRTIKFRRNIIFVILIFLAVSTIFSLPTLILDYVFGEGYHYSESQHDKLEHGRISDYEYGKSDHKCNSQQKKFSKKRMSLDSERRYAVRYSSCRNGQAFHACNLILFHGIKWWESSIIQKYIDPFENCSVQCDITTDVKMSDKADVVIIQTDTVTDQKLPKKQNNQIWVLSEYESPHNMKDANRPFVFKDVLDKYKRKFNWTMGYRRDADFVLTHGRFILRDTLGNEYSRRLDHLMKTKKKSLVWFNSHCKTVSRREKYADLLKYHTGLDIFGNCGKILNGCNPEARFREAFGLSKNGNGKCTDFIDAKYKFYLSFENSLCWDYVTEKSLQRIIPRYIVPVVRSYANHTLFHPPGSIIDTNQFDSIKRLANFLSSMDVETYRAFYSWRKYYVHENLHKMWMENICRICERSYHRDSYIRVYEDIHKWIWEPNGRPVCKDADDLKKDL